MGSTYMNVTLLNSNWESVIAEVKRAEEQAYVSRRPGEPVVVAMSAAGTFQHLTNATTHLSKYLNCIAFGVLVFDDDVFAYNLASEGRLIDYHATIPSWFRGRGPGPPRGNAEILAETFHLPNQAGRIEAILAQKSTKPSRDADPSFMLETDRHRALCSELGLPPWSAGFGFEYAQCNDLPAGLEPASIVFAG
jgi:hypothetical protein